MIGFLIGFLICKGVFVTFMKLACGLNTGLMICFIFGVLLEGLASILLHEVDNVVLREILYYAGLVMQIVPTIIMVIPYFSADKITYLQSIAIGVVFVNIAVGWFANGFEGIASVSFYYGATIIILVIDGVLSFAMSRHVLLIFNTVLAGISVVAILIGRLKMGSNMEYD